MQRPMNFLIWTMNHIDIRSGKKDDLPRVLELVKELAAFERASQEVINTVALMEQDGFGPHPVFGFFVAESNQVIVGLSLFYYRYSTWKGKRIYLEDIIVTEKERGKGIGTLLFQRTLEKTLEDSCSGMTWQALDWNEPALNFYRKYNSKLDNEWITCSLESDQIKKIIADRN